LRFNPTHIKPENEIISTETCTPFMADQNVKLIQDSTFRIEVPDDKVDFVNVTVHGENIKCGHNLYAMPLTAAESKHWAGIWLACPSLEMLDDGGRRVCTFGCRCIGRCKEIQVCRRPADYADSSWTLCYVCLTYNANGK